MRIYRKGSSFENTIAILFERAGFKVRLNDTSYGFEIDVLARKLGKVICIECKDRGYTNVGSLTYEWDSKSKRSGIDKAILAIEGREVSRNDMNYAKKLGIIILDRNKIRYLNSLNNKPLSNELNFLLKLTFKSWLKIIVVRFLKSFFISLISFGLLFSIIYYWIKSL